MLGLDNKNADKIFSNDKLKLDFEIDSGTLPYSHRVFEY